MKLDQELWKTYQKNVKREHNVILIWQIVILISFFLLWEFASRMYWIDPLLFSSPSDRKSVV